MPTEAVPFHLFYDEMQKLREDMLAQHRSQRDAMAEGFMLLGTKLDTTTDKVQGVADRVLIIEQQRLAEHELKKEALDKANRRSTLISSVVAIAVTVAFKALDWVRMAPIK